MGARIPAALAMVTVTTSPDSYIGGAPRIIDVTFVHVRDLYEDERVILVNFEDLRVVHYDVGGPLRAVCAVARVYYTLLALMVPGTWNFS